MKNDIKPLLLITLAISLIMLITFFGVSIIQKENYKEMLNGWNASLISNITSKYPEFPEEEIIKEMQNPQDIKAGLKILEKYGIDNSNETLSNQLQEIYNQKILIYSIILITYIAITITIVLIFLKKKYNKINEIIKYIEEVEHRVYNLDIRDNDEGEISKLKNEIYKITVALKEQSELSKMEKVNLSNAISDISHQIKTPITSLIIISDILYNDKTLDREKQEEFLGEMQNQLEWIKDLVLSLLKLSKLDAGVTELKIEEVNVKELVNEVIRNLNIPIEIKKHEIEIIGKETVTFKGDFNWSKEAILNIVKNCIEHTNENGKIVITYIENTLYTEIKIKDNGNGISNEDLHHIFERFYKAKNSNKESIGIGLSISKSIIERQKGKVYVKSEVNRGTEFTIQFFK